MHYERDGTNMIQIDKIYVCKDVELIVVWKETD